MKKEQKYYRIWQGKHGKDGKYREPKWSLLVEENDINQFVEWKLAEEIGILDFFEGKARWGSGHYMFINGKWISNSTNFDSSG